MINKMQIVARDLVEKSELSLFYTKIERQREAMLEFHKSIININRRLNITDELVLKLAQEIGARKILPMEKKNGKYCRNMFDVEKRWLAWKAEYEQGNHTRQIAEKWGVHPASVYYAKCRNWVSKNLERQKK